MTRTRTRVAVIAAVVAAVALGSAGVSQAKDFGASAGAATLSSARLNVAPQGDLVGSVRLN